MRVLHIISSLSTGGAEVMLRKLLATLDRARYEAMAVSLTSRSPIGEQIESDGTPVVALHARSPLALPAHFVELRRIVRSHRPHVIHGWMYHGNVAAHVARRFSIAAARPGLITSVRGALHAPAAQGAVLRAVRALDARLSKHADHIVYNSGQSARQHAQVGYDGSRAIVIPNGFEFDEWRPDPQGAQRIRAELGLGTAPLVGMVARFNVLKGQLGFLEAAALIATRHSQARFLLIGRGCESTQPELAQWISTLGLADRVLLLGERQDIRAINSALDVAVCASISESFPNAIGEAMACGTPCVVTDVGDCSVLVGDTGVIVPRADSRALAQGIEGVIALTPQERTALGRRAMERVHAEFDMRAVAARFAALYDAVARPGS